MNTGLFFFSFKHIFTYFQFLVWETSKRTKLKQYNHIQSLKSTNIYKKRKINMQVCSADLFLSVNSC